ncbi:hypothetical protein DEA8626_03649 [Defluviimonas aquaemixtae]|uniref:YjiS-like domain-containing protein n=1 Tax=Albidovulum aquaemixtae TaxID=1542388 RepID=A0A2R8BME2_9RHOB|nr:DUF1127 domain-containing protein [Defluviimonas aquaemixtae]SPH24598.1 hypothetical protein DEA8626_03649 [Defluviimonas aquaemixtae]
MSVIATNRPAAGNFSGLFGALVNAFVGWNDARVTRNALNHLTDRELDDIGLVRGDIDSIAPRN